MPDVSTVLTTLQTYVLKRRLLPFIRGDFTIKSGLNLWVVADNLRKGAASNAIQIVEKLLNMEETYEK